MKQCQVDEVFGIPIYFVASSELFYAEMGDRKYQDRTLSRLKDDLIADRRVELNEKVIYTSTGEMILTEIKEVSPHGWLVAGESRLGFGVPQNPEPKYVFPRTEKNIATYKKHKEMRERGWALIHQADSLCMELEPYPKDYWKKKAKEQFKEMASK